MSDGVATLPEGVAEREPQQYKRDAVARLREMLEQTPNAVYADYTGLDVSAMTALRRALGEQDSTLRVVKNRFMRIALDSLELPASDECLTGPTVIATLGAEPGAACKVLVDVRRDSPLVIKGALVDGQILDTAQVEALADLPPRDQLYAMLLAAMNGPIRSVAGVLQGVIRKLVGTLQAVADSQAATDQPGAEETDG
ncbi:MAG: 50S ribosomal protein L10 [Spirochaetaceae bacterium]|nr:50S ribosomal protein L10 [Spirochaetaceae bacterium]